ncbi:metalloprotease [[Mycoplasma] phocae]|uniref:Metalloprotease n=1 Tax=[Mycoplasma] phocae TaxID=142651 RepID=A0A2Z5IQS0_9BACT|nr:M28 family peptidase [[Mycoplasma] phocae]AXE60942.1 metalloprotease [[Mycoplasma] phocae]
MKKSLKIVISLASVSTLASFPLIAASCTNKSENSKVSDLEVYKQFNEFINNTHGRKAENINNFKESSLMLEKDGDKIVKSLGIKLENGKALTSDVLDPLYAENVEIDSQRNIYGSYHAYRVLRKMISSMGYENHTGNVITYPDQSTYGSIESKAAPDSKINRLNGNAVTTFKEDGKHQAIVNKAYEDMKKTGFITQGFLYDTASSRINNIGNNIIVTINPGEKNLKGKENKQREVKDFYIVSHYDSTNNVGPKGISWGATDNATGVAVNLSLLKYFSNPINRDRLGVRLHVIFVDAEELGKLGSEAFVAQFLKSKKDSKQVETNPLLKNSIGMINLDTVAGGDRMYVHSPNTSPSLGRVYGNLSTIIRDQINAISRIRSQNLKDPSQELEIHPQFTPGEYKPGETGDWSDHAPFYRNANLPVAYIESTNFAVKSKQGVYDGYAQTTNPKAWVLKDGKNIDSLVKRKINNGLIEVYDWPDGLKIEDFAIAGDIWHSDLDRPEWVLANVGDRFYRQQDTVFESLKEYFASMYSIDEKTDGIAYII